MYRQIRFPRIHNELEEKRMITPAEVMTTPAEVMTIPKEVWDFISEVCLLSTNAGGWFDKHGFDALSPICDKSNKLLIKYNTELDPAKIAGSPR